METTDARVEAAAKALEGITHKPLYYAQKALEAADQAAPVVDVDLTRTIFEKWAKQEVDHNYPDCDCHVCDAEIWINQHRTDR